MTPRKTMSFRYNRTNTHMNSVTMAAHTWPEQIQARWGPKQQEGEVDMEPHA